MINPTKQAQVDKILKYVKEHDTIYDQMIVYGSAITEIATDRHFLEIAVRMINIEHNNDMNILFELLCAANEATDGKVEVYVINDPDLLEEFRDLILTTGEIIYESTTK